MSEAAEVPEDSIPELQEKAVRMIMEKLEAEGGAFFCDGIYEDYLEYARKALEIKGHNAIWLNAKSGIVSVTFKPPGRPSYYYKEINLTMDELARQLEAGRRSLKDVFDGYYPAEPKPELVSRSA